VWTDVKKGFAAGMWMICSLLKPWTKASGIGSQLVVFLNGLQGIGATYTDEGLCGRARRFSGGGLSGWESERPTALMKRVDAQGMRLPMLI